MALVLFLSLGFVSFDFPVEFWISFFLTLHVTKWKLLKTMPDQSYWSIFIKVLSLFTVYSFISPSRKRQMLIDVYSVEWTQQLPSYGNAITTHRKVFWIIAIDRKSDKRWYSAKTLFVVLSMQCCNWHILFRLFDFIWLSVHTLCLWDKIHECHVLFLRMLSLAN